MPPRPPENVELPKVPSLTYLAELGRTHLWYDGLAQGGRPLSGSRLAIAQVMEAAEVPAELCAPYANWHKGGELGEIGKGALVLEQRRMPSARQRTEAIHRSAVLMSTLGVVNAVAGEGFQHTEPEASSAFFDRVRDSMLEGSLPGLADGPARQEVAYRLARETGQRLRLHEHWQPLGNLFDQLRDTWLERRAQTVGRRDPKQLFAIAQKEGEVVTKMAAVAVVGHEGHPALAQIGAIGGLEADKVPVQPHAPQNYTNALIAGHGGPAGRQRAAEMRRGKERELYATAMSHPGLTGRQRRIIQTVVFFETNTWSHP